MKSSNLKWYALGIAMAIPAFVIADSGLGQVKTEMETIFKDTKSIMTIVISICLFIGAAHVVYAWSNGSGDMKKILINWIVALVIGGIITTIIPGGK